MYVLGINPSHNASAALLKNGRVIAAALEERFVRQKGVRGIPVRAVEYCLEFAKISATELDLVVVGYRDLGEVLLGVGVGTKNKWVLMLRQLKLSLIDKMYSSLPIGRLLLYPSGVIAKIGHRLSTPVIRWLFKRSLARKLGVFEQKIVFADHHLSHGWAANYTFGLSQSKRLVVTNDGFGDGKSGKVFVVEGSSWQELASTADDSSLAYVYYVVTKLLKFRPNEQEHKVMGLAPYAADSEIAKIYPVFDELIVNKGLSFWSRIGRGGYWSFLRQKLSSCKPDQVAGAVQHLVEERLVEQVTQAIKQTGIDRVVLGGGLAMNVKANLQVSKIPGVKSLSICPSSGDESVAVGGCFLGYYQLCQREGLEFAPKQIDDLYLGPSFSSDQIKQVIEGLDTNELIVKKLGRSCAKTIARLLSQGKIVARFAGRMEFGARALGNRSILADPRQMEISKILNQQIKERDLWMPFAPTIIEERALRYLKNPKKLTSDFMMLGFETTRHAPDEICGALHPSDRSCRAQILKKSDNPAYYDIISEFEQLTGVGALLNTSFNLHGEPIVCTPEEAIDVLQRSGLEYLLLEDVLIEKRVR